MGKFGESNDLVNCSFCGKSRIEVAHLIAGPGVYICDECIEMCHEIITEGGPAGSSPPDRPTPGWAVADRHLLARVTEVRRRLEGQLGRRPTITELAAELGLEEQELTKVLRG